MAREATKKEWIRHRIIKRDNRDAMREFFGPEPMFSSMKEANERMNEFMDWFNTKRKHPSSGMTPEEMFESVVAARDDPQMEEAYGLVYDAMGILNRRSKRGDAEAMRMIDEALALDLKNEMALYIKSDMLMDEKKYAEASGFVGRLLEAEPQNAKAHAFKANIFVYESKGSDRGRLKEALSHSEKAYHFDDNDFDVAATHAQLLYWFGDEKYKECVGKMRKIDWKRAERFMQEYWVWEMPDFERRAGFSKPGWSDDDMVHEAGNIPEKENPKVGRNEPCPCGSGKKYKQCCIGKSGG